MKSRSAVVQAIASGGPVSRAGVAKMTGISIRTVSGIVATLEAQGLVRTVGQTGDGQAAAFEISPSAATVAAVDLGGTKVRVALCDLAGKVLVEHAEPTLQEGGDGVAGQIARMIRRTASDLAVDPHVAVVGVPGVPDPGSGVIRHAPNLAGLDRFDLAGSLGQRLGLEVLVENDVNLAALGEHWLGDHGVDGSLAFISVGTGIGAGLIVGGTLLRGSSGGAGEIGFLPFGSDPFEAPDHRAGALERAAATGAIIERYRSLSGRTADVPGVFDAANDGDAAAVRTLDEVAVEIARAAAAVAVLVDPSVIVIGGSIGSRDELLGRITRFVPQCSPRPVSVRKTQLGDHATLAGGVSVALSRLHVSIPAAGR